MTVRRKFNTETLSVGSEVIALLGTQGPSISLNRSAAVVWPLLDGESTIAEISEDIADVTGADLATVQRDVLDFVEQLGALGFLDGFGEPDPTPPPDHADIVEWTPPTGTDVGDPLPATTFTDLDGHVVGSTELSGNRTLLVNWSPHCGFCTVIASGLAHLAPSLVDANVDLVFVAIGDADTNRAVFAPGDVPGRMLLKTDGADPFNGFGTPAAYLLDANGTVTRPLVVGADQVPRLIGELTGIDIDAAQKDAPEGVVYLPPVGGACGPGASPANSTQWAGTRAYLLTDQTVGVAYSSDETAELLDRLIGFEKSDEAAGANYSVATYSQSNGRGRELNLLVRGSQQLVRSRSVGRVLRALLTYLSADFTPLDPSLVHVNATAAVRDGEAMLLPPNLVWWIKELQPRLARKGISLVDAPFASVDPERRTLVVPPPVIPHDASVLAEFDDTSRGGSELPPVLSGSYPLTAWHLASEEARQGPVSPGLALASALPLVIGRDIREAAELLVPLMTEIVSTAIYFQTPADLVAALG